MTRRYLLVESVGIACLSIWLLSCSKDGDAKVAARGAEIKLDPATACTVSGTIMFEGPPPSIAATSTQSDPMCAAQDSNLPREFTQEVVVTDGRLANVFVYISDGLPGHVPPPEIPVVIDQRGCRYLPHVAGVVVGQVVEFRNSDPTLHNVHSLSKENRPFNIAQADYGKVDRMVFEKPEVMIPIVCDVHGWMKTYVGVLPHHFFAVSSVDGRFAIPSLPPGRYTISAWHERYGTKTASVTVRPRERREVIFTFVDSPPDS